MSAPLPEALRARFQKSVEEGLSRARVGAAVETFGCHWGALWTFNPAHRAGQGRASGSSAR